MKNRFLVIVITVSLLACNNQPKTTEAGPMPGKQDSVVDLASLNLPYKLQYSSWAMGDPQNVKLVLDMYKNWENNKLEDVAAVFGDTAVFDGPNGYRAKTTRKNMVDSFKVWRGMNSSLSTDVITALSLHSTDKNEDWVTIWSMNKWTTKAGKTDSSFSNDNWQLKNGKVVYLTSLEQKPIKNQ